MKILIIRHAEPNYAIDSLTEKGFREAKFLSERLTELPIKDFYCSPLGRAKATSVPTLQKLNRSAEELPWLREFSGTVIGPDDTDRHIPWNLAPQFWTKRPELFDKDKWLSDSLMASGDVEKIYNQTAEGLDSLLEKYGYQRDGYIYRCEENSNTTIALFCHFGVGLAMLSHLLGVSLPVLWQSFFMPTSSVTTLITEERVKGEVFFKCMQVGDTSHLYANGEPVSHSGLFPEILGESV